MAWLRSQWDGPFMLKGVTRIDDAKRAVDAGVSAISVSNHGGNNLDGTPATIRLLPDIAQAVGDQVEVLLDGGVRRGGDVVKALALGARAVMIGRAYLWGLGANGQAGVENVLDLMRSGIDACLLGLGHSSIAELSPDDLVIPPGFTRRLGGVARLYAGVTPPAVLVPTVFSTVGLPAARRIEFWEAHNANALIGLDVHATEALEAAELNVQLPRVRLARVTGTAHVVERTQEVIGRTPADAIVVYLTLRGEAWFRHDGGTESLGPGTVLASGDGIISDSGSLQEPDDFQACDVNIHKAKPGDRAAKIRVVPEVLKRGNQGLEVIDVPGVVQPRKNHQEQADLEGENRETDPQQAPLPCSRLRNRGSRRCILGAQVFTREPGGIVRAQRHANSSRCSGFGRKAG